MSKPKPKPSLLERLTEFRKYLDAERIRYGNAIPVAVAATEEARLRKALSVVTEILERFDTAMDGK